MIMNSLKLSALHAKKKRKARQRRLEIWRLRDGNLTPEVVFKDPATGLHSPTEIEEDTNGVGEGSSSESKIGGELEYGHVSMMGRQRVMEDAVTMAPPEWLAGEYAFFAVYDGHGGARVAQTCGEKLHKCLEKRIEKAKEDELEEKGIDWQKVMRESFSSMDDDIEEKMVAEQRPAAENRMGSTAVVVLVGKEEMVVANCGDSRAVLYSGGVAVPLTVDHKPDRADEKERIEAVGGKIINWNGWRVEGVLSTSRSLGDHYLKPYVSSEPDVTVIKRSESDEFLIIATDGLFDVVCNVIACEVVKKCLSGQLRHHVSRESGASEAATILGELAIAKGSIDNISVIVVQLK